MGFGAKLLVSMNPTGGHTGVYFDDLGGTAHEPYWLGTVSRAAASRHRNFSQHPGGGVVPGMTPCSSLILLLC